MQILRSACIKSVNQPFLSFAISAACLSIIDLSREISLVSTLLDACSRRQNETHASAKLLSKDQNLIRHKFDA